MNKKKHLLIGRPASILMLLIFFSICSQLFAEQTAAGKQNDLFDMSLKELMDVEVGTVTTASKYEQKTTEAPSSVTIITAEEIELYGWRTLADVLRSVKGFYTSYDRAYEHLGVRGFCLPGDENSRVLILLDGFRMNENVRGHSGIGEDFLLDVDLIDRIEIVRGPGSSLYGANAIFGVINIITKKGKDIDGFEISGDLYGQENSLRRWETGRARVTFGKEFEDGTDFLISSTLFDRDATTLTIPHFSIDEGLGPTTNDGEDAYKIFTKFTFDNLTFEAGLNSREKQIPTAPLGTAFGSEYENKIEDKAGFIALTYEREFSNELAMIARSSFNFYNYRRIGWYSGEDQLTARKTYEREGNWWNTELQFTTELFEKHKVTWGAEFQYNGKQDQDSSWSGIPYPWGEAPSAEALESINNPLRVHESGENWGLYIQDEAEIFENLTANAGVRYDYYEGSGGSTNPRFALIYNHSNATTLKLLYGTAFRPPTLFELYYEDPVFEQPAALDLDPETIETYEAILEHFFDPTLLGTFSLYHYKLRDSIARQSEFAELTWRNMGTVEATGFEAGLQKKWANGTKLRASYSLADTEYQEPQLKSDVLLGYNSTRMLNSPESLFKLNLLTPLVKDKVFAGLEVQYDSKRRTIGGWNEAEEQVRDETDDSIVTNLTITCVDVIKGMDMSFGVYNLFDEKYAHPAWGDNELDTIEQNGRTFMMNLKYRF